MYDTPTYCIWRRKVSVGVQTKVISRLEHFKGMRAMGVITHLPKDLRGGRPAQPVAPYVGAANRQGISFGWFRDRQGDTHTTIHYRRGGR